MDEYARIAKERLTLWHEIDRQRMLSSPDPETARRVVEKFHDSRGGFIVQCEAGPGLIQTW